MATAIRTPNIPAYLRRRPKRRKTWSPMRVIEALAATGSASVRRSLRRDCGRLARWWISLAMASISPPACRVLFRGMRFAGLLLPFGEKVAAHKKFPGTILRMENRPDGSAGKTVRFPP